MLILRFLLSVVLTVVVKSAYFRNDGTLGSDGDPNTVDDAWDGHTHECKGSVDEITNMGFNGSSNCLKFTQRYEPTWHGRYHAEVYLDAATRLGETKYFGFAFMLDKAWRFDDKWYTISQFITNFKDWPCPKGHKEWTPTTMVYLIGDVLYTRIRSGDICHETEKGNVIYKLAHVTPGEWHTVVIGANWQVHSFPTVSYTR